MILRPFHEWIQVSMPRLTETPGGIALPEKARESRERWQVGKVVAVGDGAFLTMNGERIPSPIKAGQMVFFNFQAAEMLPRDWQTDKENLHYLVRERDVSAALPVKK